MVNTYQYSLKKKVCKLIVEDKKSTSLTALKYGIPLKTVEKWITKYNKDNHCFDNEPKKIDYNDYIY